MGIDTVLFPEFLNRCKQIFLPDDEVDLFLARAQTFIIYVFQAFNSLSPYRLVLFTFSLTCALNLPVLRKMLNFLCRLTIEMFFKIPLFYAIKVSFISCFTILYDGNTSSIKILLR